MKETLTIKIKIQQPPPPRCETKVCKVHSSFIMNCGQLCRMVCFLIVIVAISLFLKDVHSATQERIAALKKEVVVSSEQSNAMRAELEEMKLANDAVNTELEESKKAHAELLASRRALDASEELQRQEKDAIEQKSIDLGLKLKECEREKGSLQNLYRDLEAEKDQIKQKSQESDGNLQKCKHEKDGLLAEFAKEKETLNANINMLHKEVKDLKETLNRANSAVAHMDSEIKALNDKLSKCDTALKSRAVPPKPKAAPVAKPAAAAAQQPAPANAGNHSNGNVAHPAVHQPPGAAAPQPSQPTR
jgi:DNA repair exonuclease SbcCD ATPase subunit